MALNLSGKDFQGAGGVRLEEPGTYECTLIGASAYRNNLYQSEETRPELTLIWDTGLVDTNNQGEDAPVLIYDSYLNITLNEKANLTKRLTALAGGKLNIIEADLSIGGVTSLDALPHRDEGRVDIPSITLNGEELFGKTALVSVTINDKGYPKVTTVAAPVKKNASKYKKATETEAPAGAPT